MTQVITKANPLPVHDGIMLGLFLSSRDRLAVIPRDDEMPAGAVREDETHITLAIINSKHAAQGELERLLESVTNLADVIAPLDVVVGGVGVFKNDPEVVYAQVRSDSLASIQSYFADMLVAYGFELVSADRAFTPHVTLFYAPVGSAYTVEVPDTPIRFSQITLTVMGTHYTFPLAGEALSREWERQYKQQKDAEACDSPDMAMQADEVGVWIKRSLESEAPRIISKVVNGKAPPEGTQFVWAGIATNAYQDRTQGPFNVLPLKSLADDIERKALAIEQNAADNYGLLDVMHEHQWTIGVCTGRAIVEGTRMEMDWGYISPEYNDLGEALLGQEFTMSHETALFFKTGDKKIALPKAIAKVLLKTRLSEYLWLDTFRFTVAKKGAEANPRTYFKVYRLENKNAQN